MQVDFSRGVRSQPSNYAVYAPERKAFTSPSSFINHSTLLLERSSANLLVSTCTRVLDRLRMRRRVGSTRRRGNHMHDHSRFQRDIDWRLMHRSGVSLCLSLSLLLTRVTHAQYRKRFRISYNEAHILPFFTSSTWPKIMSIIWWWRHPVWQYLSLFLRYTTCLHALRKSSQQYPSQILHVKRGRREFFAKLLYVRREIVHQVLHCLRVKARQQMNQKHNFQGVVATRKELIANLDWDHQSQNGSRILNCWARTQKKTYTNKLADGDLT